MNLMSIYEVMPNVRKEFVIAAYDKANALIHDDNIHVQFKTIKQYILEEEKDLTTEEKLEAIKRLDGDYDYFKVVTDNGPRRICENCQKKCLATLYCEFCIRNYLKKNFSNWSSENEIIDNLIQKCQESSLIPYMIVEWIPFDHFENLSYLSRGGCSEVYSADWINGCYKEWDNNEKILKRTGSSKVVLKILENVENANRTWLEEATAHLCISNKWGNILQCYGLTKNPSSDKFMLVMNRMDMDLRNYLQKYHGQISWKTKIRIGFDIVKAICRIHEEKSIHRDLHSGNVLFSQEKNDWYISDLGFCGPADKPLSSVYGSLPYIAPEVIFKNDYSFASDVYGVGMLIWEIVFEQPPFSNRKHDYDLASNITNGMRPKIIPETPIELKELIEQCWDVDPMRRPKIRELWNKLEEFNKSINQNNEYWKSVNFNLDSIGLNSNISTSLNNFHSKSKVFTFENIPKPRNAPTEEETGEQEGYCTKQFELNVLDIPEDVLQEN